MKLADFLFARNASTGFRRLTALASIVMSIWWYVSYAGQWSDAPMDFDHDQWLTLFIGLAVAGVIPPLLISIYIYLPKLGPKREGELAVLAIGCLGTLVYGYMLYSLNYSRSFDLDDVIELMVFGLAIGVAGIYPAKAVYWVWQGFRHDKLERASAQMNIEKVNHVS